MNAPQTPMLDSQARVVTVQLVTLSVDGEYGDTLLDMPVAFADEGDVADFRGRLADFVGLQLEAVAEEVRKEASDVLEAASGYRVDGIRKSGPQAKARPASRRSKQDRTIVPAVAATRKAATAAT